MAANGRKNADDALVLYLAAGLTVEAAARKARVSPRTAHRRLADAGFRQRVTEARAEMVQQWPPACSSGAGQRQGGGAC